MASFQGQSSLDSDPQKAIKALTGARKASVLLVALGSEVTSAVMQQLSQDEIERLTAEILLLRKIDPEVRNHVINECRTALGDDSAFGGAEYAREVLEQVLGEAKAKELLARLGSGAAGISAFRWLRTVPGRQLAKCLIGERPQVIALVLGHLAPDQAAQVMSALPDNLRGEVALRLTTMQPTDHDSVKHIAEVLYQKVSAQEAQGASQVGGNKAVVEILNNVERSTEKKILDYLAQVDEAVAQQIKESMFTFDDLLSVDDRSIQIILRDVPQEDLRLALKSTSDEMKELFFRNMSQRAAETLKEDLEASGPTKLKDIEAAQSRIANIARTLEEAGEISLRQSEDDIVV